MKLFRPGASPHQTALAMVGAKAGSAVVIIGAEDPAFSAEVALVTGLNGRTLIVVASADAQPRVEAAATNAGALVDIETAAPTSLPAADGAFDIAVVTGLAHISANLDEVVREAARVVRPGGRVVVIHGRKVGGLKKLIGSAAAETDPAGEGIVGALSRAGLRGTRKLGSEEGISYFEGTK